MNMEAKEIIKKLEQNGYEAYFVGGCVRDELMGVPFNDEDVTTNATPQQIEEIFSAISKVQMVGGQFLVTLVDGVEVATYRREPNYTTPGKPTVVVAKSAREDASRREFTIGAIYKNSQGEIFDPFNGRRDIEKGIIRAVGDPVERFSEQEDPSRMLRALYFAARFGFEIEQETWTAIQQQRHLLSLVPNELKGKIIRKVIHSGGDMAKFLELLRDSKTLMYVFPELDHTEGVKQNPKYHNSDVLSHIIRVVRSANQQNKDTVLLMGALYHDNAKGLLGIRTLNKERQPSDHGHEEAGAPLAKKAMLRLGFGLEIAKQVEFLVRFHGLRLTKEAKTSSIIRQIRKWAQQGPFRNKEELRTGIQKLFALMEFDAKGFQPEFGKKQQEINDHLRERFFTTLEDMVVYRQELPVTGKDIAQFGFEKEQIGDKIDQLIQMNVKNRARALQLLGNWSTQRANG